jgi:LytS/YehU family sensor histidine kinase
VSFGDLFVYWWLVLLPAGVIVYAAVVGLRTAEVNRAELRARERQAQQLAAQLSEAQLKVLRGQIQPHFLFNTLNAVIALVRDRETGQAVNALTTLSTLLRTALRTGATHTVALREELAFTANYLSIERMRFGDRLRVGIDVPPSLGDARVPTFMLQPFAENALHHGLRQHPHAVRVDISARAERERLVLRIEDDGAGLAEDWEIRTASGFGIANSRARLRQLYGSAAILNIARRDRASGTLVEIVLPLERETAAASAAVEFA